MEVMLVTGVNGFLGSRIKEHFKDRYQIVAPAHAEMDITNFEEVMQYFERYEPQKVIHCAAVSDVGQCTREPEKSFTINVTGTENIAKACADHHTKLVFCSSDQIYFGSRENNAHKESERVTPQNVYGRQKLEAEQRMLQNCPDAVALRLSWMYDTVSNAKWEHGDFLRNLASILQRGERASFPCYDYRGITYVGDALRNLSQVFELPGGIYNYGSENQMNTYEMVVAFFKAIGIPEERVKVNEQAFADNPRNISMNIDKIRSHGIIFPNTLEALITCMTDSGLVLSAF